MCSRKLIVSRGITRTSQRSELDLNRTDYFDGKGKAKNNTSTCIFILNFKYYCASMNNTGYVVDREVTCTCTNVHEPMMFVCRFVIQFLPIV